MDLSDCHTLVIADSHIGPRKYLGQDSDLITKVLIRSLKYTVDLAIENGISRLIIAGDLFDCPKRNTKSVPPLWVKNVNDQLVRFCDSGGQVYVLSGNHDTSDIDSSLLYLNFSNRYKCCFFKNGIISDQVPPYKEDIVFIPFEFGSNAVDAIKDIVSNSKDCKYLIGHFGIYQDEIEKNTYMKKDPWFVSAAWLGDFLKHSEIKYVISGHCHDYRDWSFSGVRSIVPGALNPRSASEVGLNYGNVVGISDEGVKVFKNVIPGIRYIEIRKDYYDIEENRGDNWIFLKEDPGSILTKVPIGLDDTKGAVTPHTRELPVDSVSIDVKDVATGDAKEAIRTFVTESGVQFKGPRIGLLSEAIGRLDGVRKEACIAPKNYTLNEY